jgi:3-isopropylmalate/(R)-2-methylmalate dehydratase small subunit
VAGKNFGCGSSREHAAWAIADYGFRVVVSSFFADIFKNNALNNHLLPVQVTEDFLQGLLEGIAVNPSLEVEVNLPEQSISVPALQLKANFHVNPYKKLCLQNGFDDIDYLISMKEKVLVYEGRRPQML